MKNWKPIIATLGLALTLGAFTTLNAGCHWFKKDNPAAVRQASAQTGNTPLHDAALNGKLDDATKLIEDGADVNAANDQGNTPLHFAATAGHADVATMLLENGADKALANKDGKTALDLAKDGKMDDVIKALGGEETTGGDAAADPGSVQDDTAADAASDTDAAPAATDESPAQDTPEEPVPAGN